MPWAVLTLSRPPRSPRPFYPLSEFRVFNQLSGKGQPVAFPSYLQLSSNYYQHSWWNVAHRRLKNVTMVMEWVPDPAALEEVQQLRAGAAASSLTDEQEAQLRAAFNQISKGAGHLTLEEFGNLIAVRRAPLESTQSLTIHQLTGPA